MSITFLLIVLCAVGSGLIAGVFYAFSTFVMRALARLPARDGIAAMQSINIVVINPMFLGVFMGTALICVATFVLALIRWDVLRSLLEIGGAVSYIVGTFGVTMFGNVPLNNRLMRVKQDDADASEVWSHYLRRWTMWNHVRTIAALIAMVLFILALRR
jgi:uncharacterized membrane protein